MPESSGVRPTVTVGEFYEAGRGRLDLELIAGGAGMRKVIREAALNRLGLALTGFSKYFAHRRVQILGNAELAYLLSLPDPERVRRLEAVLGFRIPCLVVTRQRKVPPAFLALAERTHTPFIRTPMVTMDFVNAATILMQNLTAPRMLMQGTMVEILGIGVLLQGRHGVGKSEAALALIQKGYSLVADDATFVRRDSSGVLLGSARGVTRYHMEIRGVGIIHVPSLFGVASVRDEKQLDLVIRLCAPQEVEDETRDGQQPGVVKVFDVEVPCLKIPVGAGRELANVVETAALNYKLKRLGHDAAKELDEKLTAVLTERGRKP